MALYRGMYGGGAASGAIGSMVCSHNSAGQYMRARTTPTNPRSSQQTAVRNAVTTLSTRYVESLTAAQRAAWAVYAQNVSVLNRLGDAIFLSAISMYVRSNTPRIQAGLSVIDAAPIQFDLGSIPQGTLTAAAAGSTGTLTIGSGGGTTGEGTILLYISRPQNASINFFNGPYRFAGSGQATSGTMTATLPFTAGPAGSKLFFQYRVSRADGRLSGTFQGTSTL